MKEAAGSWDAFETALDEVDRRATQGDLTVRRRARRAFLDILRVDSGVIEVVLWYLVMGWMLEREENPT